MQLTALTLFSVVATLGFAACAVAQPPDTAAAKRAPRTEPAWHSPSLTTETVAGRNGAITTATAAFADARMGITDSKVAEQVAPGVYALRGWGIAHSFAIEAAKGWIIVDTGDSTRAAAEMRETLEQALGHKIKVAAILLTHWH